MAFSDKKLASVEGRLAEIKQLTGDLEKSLAAIAGREQLINAVKAEVEQIYEIGARSKADLAHVAEHRGELTAVKNQVDLLLSRIADTDERIAAIDARRKLIDEFTGEDQRDCPRPRRRAHQPETVGEHKAVVDQVGENRRPLELSVSAQGRGSTRKHLAERMCKHQTVALAPASRRQ
jgi:hypothetical protein